MPKIKLEARVHKAVAEALAPYAERLFDDQTGEWTAVVTFDHRGRSEDKKTEDDLDFVEHTVKIGVIDAELVFGPHKQAAEAARDAARRERETAGTLLEGTFRDE